MEDFKMNYKQAYDHISPKPDYLDGILGKLEEKQERRRRMFLLIMRPAAAACAVMLVLTMTLLPAAAKTVPAVYNMIEKYAPALTDFVLPIEESDTSQGITMQVEAINAEDQTAEIIVSFSDAEGSRKNLIKGKIDLYDSYDLQAYGASYHTGGCSFLEYDKAEDKAYFKITVSTDGEYDRRKLRFRVHQLLVNDSKEEKEISLENIIMEPQIKAVSLNGLGGSGDREILNQYIGASEDGSPLPGAKVMDIVKADESMIEALIVTGVGYSDGILRVQTCRGNFSNADRHMQPFILDSEGNERHNDFSAGWQEEVDGERILFEEHWFLVEESELQGVQLYGVFYVTDGSVKGDWEVTCELE